MARRKWYRRQAIFAPAALIAITAQGAAVLAYEATRTPPVPVLRIHLEGEGTGTVLVTVAGQRVPIARCSTPRCEVELPVGTQVRLTAVLGEDATFGGFRPWPARPPAALVPYLGDPLAGCLADDAVTAATRGDALDCGITIIADTAVEIEFGAVPKSVDVAWTEQAPPAPLRLLPPAPLRPVPPELLPDVVVEKPEKTDPARPAVLAPPPSPVEVAILPPPPPPEPPPPNMRSVEVADKNEVDKAPEDATHLSDKNRDVTEETVAKQTNLEKEQDGKATPSIESSDHTSTEVGGPEESIHQLETAKDPTTDRGQESDTSGAKATATGGVSGEGGDNGEHGHGEAAPPGMLAMRGVEGRGDITEQGAKKRGEQGTPGIDRPLSMEDYERIAGKDAVDDERELAKRRESAKKGRWEKKLAAVQSSLENFTPDVRTGNQTALKTRAAPFAVFVARMHRRIHELWGFGYLPQLDDRGARDPLNNFDLWVNIELSIDPDGTVHKMTIAKTSGKLEFDVAALDVVSSAGPYDPTPEAIRSVDGRVYLRWGFYRNWRQCGTFNVEPYILDSVPDDGDGGVMDDSALVANRHRKQAPVGDRPVTPDDGKADDRVSPASAVKDDKALFTANLWVAGFATGNVDKLISLSVVPFHALGEVAAQTPGDLKSMYAQLVVESGQLKAWKLLTAAEYGQLTGSPAKLPEGSLILLVNASKSTFAIVLTRARAGEYQATQLVRA